MPGGLLNIIALGNANIFLTGNPSKTFFRVTYSKYTNFGLQKFRIDYDGIRDLRLTEPSTFSFKIKRYAELLMDTYIGITIPDIWSPIYSPTSETGDNWAPYDFRWIRNLGTNIIKEVTIHAGSFLLAKYSGEYIAACVDRDFTSEKKKLFNTMSGNIAELNDPSNAFNRANTYPSAFFAIDTSETIGTEPSIRGRQLYIPINAWFTLDSRCAFPLISLQYNELEIQVTLRPIQELFQVRDVFDADNEYPYVQPDFNQTRFQMYRFLQSPPSADTSIQSGNYTNLINNWNADIHLMTTYAFLSKDEAKLFAAEDQIYLVKDVFQYQFDNITGSSTVSLQSNGMVSSWMWYLQRNDVYLRNEWSNYTNWPYHNIPSDIQIAPQRSSADTLKNIVTNNIVNLEGQGLGPFINPDGKNTGLYTSGNYSVDNQKEIMQTFAIVLDGKYRENTLSSSIFNYIEKYTRTNAFAQEGLYCYNFCLDTNPHTYQPSGAINLGKFKNVDLEITTYVPPIDRVGANFQVICDGNGVPIATNKSNWRLYDYNYNMTLFEERYNIISFIGGNCGTLYAR
jgi:hypothetical protein